MMSVQKEHSGMYLSELLQGLIDESQLVSVSGITVEGITIDSREVLRDYVFVAVQGAFENGAKYISNAIDAGASVILVDEGDTDVEHDETSLLKEKVITVSHLKEKAGVIAARFYGLPANSLNVIGVTGTDGKTTVSHYIAQCLHSETAPCGLLGTLGNGIYGALNNTNLTTTDAITLQHNLFNIVTSKAQNAVIEVSSHALDQGRVSGVNFDIAVLTNLGRDHLDYHKTIENYSSAKRKLFTSPTLNTVVVNIDDRFGRKITSICEDTVTVWGYTCTANDDELKNLVDHCVIAEKIETVTNGLKILVSSPSGPGELNVQVLGKFNVYNVLAALTTLLADKIPLHEALRRVQAVKPVAGRMESIITDGKPTVVIDYAHTPQALDAACKAIRDHFDGALWCVFGSGGDRDIEKRPLMASAAENNADHIIVTSDNPRFENPQHIIDGIMSGFKNADGVTTVIDRKSAIQSAILHAKKEDVVLIAGKGHEKFQLVRGESIEFTDRVVANDILRSYE